MLSYKVKVLVVRLCQTLCDPINCSLPGCPVHGILQARILEWVAISSSRGSSQPKDRTQVSCITCGFFTIWATREGQGKCFQKIHRAQSSPTGLEVCREMLGFKPHPSPSCLHLPTTKKKEKLFSNFLVPTVSEMTSTFRFFFFCFPNHTHNEWVIVTQSCPTLCDPMDCTLTGSFVHGILQARILEWVAISFSNMPNMVSYFSRIFYLK